MSLEDIVAMEVPKPVLQYVAKENKIKPSGITVEEYAHAIVRSANTRDIAELLASEYRFAGKTAVNIFTPIAGISSEWDKKEYYKNHLAKKYSKEVFDRGVRPKLTEKPQLIAAYERDKSTVLAFSYLGKPQRQLHNYEIIKYVPQILDYAIVHFDPFSLEIRAAMAKEKLYKNAVLETMDIPNDKVEWEMLTNLSENEARKLAKELGAGLIGAKHKMTEGIYDFKEVKANPQIDDLYDQEEYNQEFKDLPCKMRAHRFPYKYKIGLEDIISYRITDRGLIFISEVPEEIISYVAQKITDIRKADIQKTAAK